MEISNPYDALSKEHSGSTTQQSNEPEMQQIAHHEPMNYPLPPESPPVSPSFTTSIPEVPITQLHKVPEISPAIHAPGTPRAVEAADIRHPHGTVGRPDGRTVLQQHVDFFDRNKDGIITPIETFQGFRALGFNILISIMAIFVIHPPFSLMSADVPWFLPVDPFLRIWTSKIHRSKHGSDTGVYDLEGRFIPQKFEELFSKWDSEGRDGLNFWDLLEMTQNLFVTNDIFGWFAAKIEWTILYLLCADENGFVSREKIRGVYDGSLFYTIEAENRMKKQQSIRLHWE